MIHQEGTLSALHLFPFKNESKYFDLILLSTKHVAPISMATFFRVCVCYYTYEISSKSVGWVRTLWSDKRSFRSENSKVT